MKGLSKGLEIRTTDYGRMGIEQAEQILRRGRNLYLQRSTPEYERRFQVTQRAGVFYEVELTAEDARIPSGNGEPTARGSIDQRAVSAGTRSRPSADGDAVGSGG
jgi:hypothetical protein